MVDCALSDPRYNKDNCIECENDWFAFPYIRKKAALLAGRLHIDRIAGRHRDHRDSGRAAPAGIDARQNSGATNQLPEQ